jgi:hypothetical protein
MSKSTLNKIMDVIPFPWFYGARKKKLVEDKLRKIIQERTTQITAELLDEVQRVFAIQEKILEAVCKEIKSCPRIEYSKTFSYCKGVNSDDCLLGRNDKDPAQCWRAFIVSRLNQEKEND